MGSQYRHRLAASALVLAAWAALPADATAESRISAGEMTSASRGLAATSRLRFEIRVPRRIELGVDGGLAKPVSNGGALVVGCLRAPPREPAAMPTVQAAFGPAAAAAAGAPGGFDAAARARGASTPTAPCAGRATLEPARAVTRAIPFNADTVVAQP